MTLNRLDQESVRTDVGMLQKELEQKDLDLHQAATYGKTLLAENTQLKCEVQRLTDELGHLQEVLRNQEANTRRIRSEVGRTAEIHIAELEEKLDRVEQTRSKEREAAAANQEEYRKTIEMLNTRIEQLEDTLRTESERCECEKKSQIGLKEGLSVCEMKNRELTAELCTMKYKVTNFEDIIQESKKEISELTCTRDQVVLELQMHRERAEMWEKECTMKDTELKDLLKEHSDCQALITHLQIQLKQQMATVQTPDSAVSRKSLFEELTLSEVSSCNRVSSTEDVSLLAGSDRYQECDYFESMPVKDEAVTDTFHIEDIQTQAWVDHSYCQRCQELSMELEKQIQMVDATHKQLVIAIHQKLSLQKQIDEWEIDMAAVVHRKVSQQLEHEGASYNSNWRC